MKIELTNTFYKVKINNTDKVDEIIDILIDKIDYYELQYEQYEHILENLYNKYNIYVKNNNINPNLILCENIIIIEKKIHIYEELFIKTIGKLSKYKLRFELIMDSHYKL
jgi:hypothetical protein